MEFLDNPAWSGIFNCGTGRSQTFNEVAVATINSARTLRDQGLLTLEEMLEQGVLSYREFPEGLESRYQSFTEGQLERLKAVGSEVNFYDVQSGVNAYVRHLSHTDFLKN